MGKRHGVARSAGLLISDLTSEVVSVDIRKVIRFWNFTVGDVIGSFIVFSPRLNLLERFFEFLCVLSKLLLGFGLLTSLGKAYRFIAVSSSLRVTLR